MNENSGFAAFAMWNALKLHFTSNSYDYFKYNGKTNVSKQSFSTRKDKYQFYKLSRKYSLDELKNYYVANFLVDNNHWVGDLLTPQGEEVYRKWQKINQALTYTFENDIIYLLDKYGIKGEEIFRVDRGNYPKLLEEVMRGTVQIETLIMLNNNANFVDTHWAPRISDDIVWPQWQMKIKKYMPFLHYDKDKIRNILKEKVKEYAN
jgi:hypothetical protein